MAILIIQQKPFHLHYLFLNIIHYQIDLVNKNDKHIPITHTSNVINNHAIDAENTRIFTFHCEHNNMVTKKIHHITSNIQMYLILLHLLINKVLPLIISFLLKQYMLLYITLILIVALKINKVV